MTRSTSAFSTSKPRVVVAGLLLACMLLLVCGARPVDAAYAPSAYTGEATQTAYTSATLKGVVGPGNQQTSYYFQYGQNGAYEAQTPLTVAGGGTQSLHVAAVVSGLSPGTTYHYRLVATNHGYTVDGNDRTFTTKKLPLVFTLATRLSRSVFGRPLSVLGTLTGTGSAGRAVQLLANPFPYLGGFKPLGSPQLTNAGGGFSLAVGALSQNTQLRVATVGTPSVASSVMVALVAVRVTLHLRPTGRQGFVRFYGTVAPAEVGAQVAFQLMGTRGRHADVSATVVKRYTPTVSRFSRVIRIRHAGLYRASVHVLSGAHISNHSRAIRVN